MLNITSGKGDVRRPKETDHVSKWHSNMNGQHELNAIRRPPQLDHGSEIILHVDRVLGNAVLKPVHWIPGCPDHEFLDGVVTRKVDDRKMHDNIKEDHLHSVEYTRRVLEFGRKGEFRKSIHGGEPLAVLGDHEPVLKATQVSESKHDKDCVALKIHFRQTLALGDDLRHEICRHGLGRRNAQLEGKLISLGPGFGSCFSSCRSNGCRRFLSYTL